MYWNRSAADIAAAWQAEIENKVETGATAVLLGGAPSNTLVSAATLLALQKSMVQRHDVATPLLVTGGNSATWLGMLLPPQLSSSDPSAPAPNVLYGGADEATYLAMVGLTASLSSAAPGASKAGTGREAGAHFAPRMQPGAATAWEVLPLVEVGEQPAPALAPTPAPPDPTADWVAWGVMLLAFCLIFSALLI